MGAKAWLGLATLVCVPPIWAQAAVTPAPSAEPVPVIAVEDDWPPFAWVPQAGAPVRGFAVAVVRKVFEDAGVPIALEVMPFGRCMHEARTGAAAACFNSVFNEDNRRDYLLHSTPLFNEPLAVLERAWGPMPTTAVDIRGLEGHSVGYVQSYQYPEWFMKNKAIVRVPAGSDGALLLMLDRGRVDYVLYGATVAAWRVQTDPALRGMRIRMVGQVSNDGFGLAFSRRHPQAAALMASFDRGLRRLQASPAYRELQRQHLPRPLSP